jgi:ribosomal protein S18 acetylase RimI-like enzyme
MRIEVRKARLEDPTDGQALIEILDSYARETVGGGRPLRSEVRARLIPRLQEQSNAHVWMAFTPHRAVGVAICFQGFSTFAARPLLNLHDLAVLPDHRGQGVGTALLQAVEAGAEELGCCKITLEVQENNVRARELYVRVGFGDFAPGDEDSPTFLLEKKL